MTQAMRRRLLILVAALCACALVVTFTDRDLGTDSEAPKGTRETAAWLTRHPADWLATSALADGALDSDTARRVELWRSAHSHARHLAPYRTNTDAGFVRAGLFHWYELDTTDRTRVLTAAAPLMHDPRFFDRMHLPLWQLTRDFGWIHRNAPSTLPAHTALRNLALREGLFNDYRSLRDDLRADRLRAFSAQRQTADFNTLLELLPEPLTTADDPLVRAMLAEMDRRPFDAKSVSGKIESLANYAVTHRLAPLAGLMPLVELPSSLRDVTRARAAIALDQPSLATRLEMTSSLPNAPEWEPYYVDRARYEARKGEARAADAYLVRASSTGVTPTILAAAEEVARMLQRPAEAARYHEEIVERARRPRVWSGLCSGEEVCAEAHTNLYVTDGRFGVSINSVQSDETPPYVEIFVDDALAAEGTVESTRSFEIRASGGMHAVQVRLVNNRTRNGFQRRIRLS